MSVGQLLHHGALSNFHASNPHSVPELSLSRTPRDPPRTRECGSLMGSCLKVVSPTVSPPSLGGWCETMSHHLPMSEVV